MRRGWTDLISSHSRHGCVFPRMQLCICAKCRVSNRQVRHFGQCCQTGFRLENKSNADVSEWCHRWRRGHAVLASQLASQLASAA